MTTFRERIDSGCVVLADGAMGTQLFDRGLAPGGCPESFNLDRPGVLEEIARAYLDAGAEVLQTNTFGASPLRLVSYGLDGHTEEINRIAVEAARHVAGGGAWIVASCGPSGRVLKPYGDVDPERVYASFLRQAEALVAAGVDAVCVETMCDMAEARLAVRAARAAGPSVLVIATMCFDRTRKGFRTAMGNAVPEAAEGLGDAGADVVGANCGKGIDEMIDLARELRAATALPISVRPNAGLPRLVDGRPVYADGPAYMAERVARLVDAGVRIVGGCCGTTPEHIRAFRAVIPPAPGR